MEIEGEEQRLSPRLMASATRWRVVPFREMVTKVAEQTWSRGKQKLPFWDDF